MLIQDVMTRNPACCKPSDTIDHVAKMMVDHDCGEIPVCTGTKLVGVITDRDIACRAVATNQIPSDITAADIMTKNIVTIADDATIETALDLMNRKLVRRLPVVNRNADIVGIVSQADLITKLPTPEVAKAMKGVSKKTRHEARL